MGTHPIFESDFDCLTECYDYMFFEIAHGLNQSGRVKNRRKLFSDVRNRIQRDLDMKIQDKMSTALLKILKKKNEPNYYSVKENEKFRSKHWYPKNIVGPDIIQMSTWRPQKSEMRCQKYLKDPIRLF